MREQLPSEQFGRQNATLLSKLLLLQSLVRTVVELRCTVERYISTVTDSWKVMRRVCRRRSSLTPTSSHTSYGATKRSHLWTTLTSSVCQHRCRYCLPMPSPSSVDAVATVHSVTTWLRPRAGVSSPCLSCWDCVRTAAACCATLLVTLLLLIKLFLLLISPIPGQYPIL